MTKTSSANSAQPTPNATPPGDVTSILCRRLAAIAQGSKYERLADAILKSIIAGELRAGDQLPPEPNLADATGLSLGTVRRCLSTLAASGVLTREHGRGTFVSSQTQSVNDLWHFRFLAEDSVTLLPVYTRVLRRGIVKKRGAWSRILGPSKKGYVQIERAFNVDSRFVCHSDFYLSADRFLSIIESSAARIETLGLKNLIAEEFQVPTIDATKSGRVVPAPEEIAEVIGVEPGENVLLIEITAKSYGNQAISYQAIHVPPQAAPMDFSVRPEASQFRRGQLQ